MKIRISPDELEAVASAFIRNQLEWLIATLEDVEDDMSTEDSSSSQECDSCDSADYASILKSLLSFCASVNKGSAKKAEAPDKGQDGQGSEK